MANLNKPDVRFNGRAILKTEENGRPVASPSREYIRSEASGHNQIRMILKVPVPVSEILCSLPKVLVVTDGDMYSVQTALPHLFKDLAGPVAVLQAVDPGVCQYGFGFRHFITNRFQREGSTSVPLQSR